MAIPDVTMTVTDGALGSVPASIANTHLKMGTSSAGTVNTIYSFTDKVTLANTLGQGPLVEAAAHALTVTGGPVYCMPINPSVIGVINATTHGGTGTPTVTGVTTPAVPFNVKIIAGTTQSTVTFQVSVNGGAYSSTLGPLTNPYTYAVPGTLTTLTFPAFTYNPGDVWSYATTGALPTGGTGTYPTQASSPLDSYTVLVTIVGAGVLGTGTFTWSLDGGNTTSPATVIPSSGNFSLPNSGVGLTFAAGTYVVADTYTITTVAPGFANSDVTAGFTAALADARLWGFVHIVGKPTSAAATASLASVVDTQLVAAATAYRFAFGIVEGPWDSVTNNDAAWISAFTNFTSVRTCVCVGDVNLTSATATGRVLKRPVSWPFAARVALIPPGEDPAKVARGPLPSVQSLFRDENATPGLDSQRFVTARTIVGYPGYFITNGNIMAPVGSDFALVQRRRVMDRACQITRAAEIQFLNDSALVDANTGFILPLEANRFEKRVNSQLKAGIVATGDASGATVSVSRTTNLLSTSVEPVTVRIVPLSYYKGIQTNIGFSNPAIAQ